MITILLWDCYLHTATAHGCMMSTEETLYLVQFEKSAFFRKRLTGTGQKWWSTVKPCRRIARGLLNIDIFPGLLLEFAYVMMTSSNGSIFRVTGPLCGEFTGHRWIPLTKASDVELRCFVWSVPVKTVEQTTEKMVIWDAIVRIMTSP